MPRKKKEIVAHVARKESEARAPVFKAHEVEAAGMVTITATDEMWNPKTKLREEFLTHLKGSYVRLAPPPGVSSERLASLIKLLKECGCAAVKVLPVVSATLQKVQPPKEVVASTPADVRKFVIGRARSMAKSSVDIDGLVKLLDECMSKAGM